MSSSPSKGGGGQKGDIGNGANVRGEFVFDIIHRQHLNFLHQQPPQNLTEDTEDRSYSPIQSSLKRGLLREESLNRASMEERMNWRSRSAINTREGRKRRMAEASAAVVAAGGEYMVQMQIGTPPKPVLLILDTGSGLTWIQCKQCVQCAPQQEPLFDPSASSSYTSLSCQSPHCLNTSSQFQCNTINNTCEYGVQYGESSFTTGVVSKDILQLQDGSVMVTDFVFGCGIFTMGDFVGNSGLLGLSRSNISFPSQLGMQHPMFGRKFTLCFNGLANSLKSSSAKGFISFGNSSGTSNSSGPPHNGTDPSNESQQTMVYTPFAATPFPTQFYYIGLEGISVDGARLPINSSVFELDEHGDGGTVIDSGTTLTLLNPQAFLVLRDAFRSAGVARRKLPELSAVGFNSTGHVIDTCYQFDGYGGNDTSNSSLGGRRRPESSAVPSIALYFVGGVELVLPPDSVLFPFEEGLYCLAFASTMMDLGINVIGNIQQNLRIEYDLENSRIGFQSVTTCAR
ncbi:unnamed protein product [Calypogeia fissa]